MRSRTFLTLLVVLSMLIAACSSGDDGGEAPSGADTQADTGGSSNGGGGDEGSTDGDGGETPVASGDMPSGAGDDFPVPIPDGWVIDNLAVLEENGVTMTGQVQLYYPLDDFDSLVSFYDEWTDEQPDEYVRSEVGDTDVLYSRIESPIQTITISRDDQEYQDVQYTFLLVVSQSPG